MTELFNIRSATTPSDAVNIMRPGKWGNPFSEKLYGREACIKLYEHWLFLNPAFVTLMRKELAHRDIVCCCWPKPCHGDVIVRVLAGEEPQPLAEDDKALVAYLSRKPDPLLEFLVHARSYLNNPAPDDDGAVTVAAWESLVERILPTLQRITANNQEQWPKPPTETVSVEKQDILDWREEWLGENAKNDGTDEVTPFDKYLYGR